MRPRGVSIPTSSNDRLGAAYAARTHGDLAVLTADLPPAPPPPAAPVPIHRRLPDFWPKWVLLATTVVAILRLGGAHDRRMG
jgi:hypothetical protein